MPLTVDTFFTEVANAYEGKGNIFMQQGGRFSLKNFREQEDKLLRE